jgi:hypothetical protein
LSCITRSTNQTVQRPTHTTSDPMKDYAFFLSLTDNYTFLFNALLNSIELYGCGKYADVVVIHDESLTEEYKAFIQSKCANMETTVRFVPIVSLPVDKSLGKVMTVKFYRYKIMAEIGQQYRSICFIDTDIFLVSGVEEYFDIAANTDVVVAVNDNVVRHYKTELKKGTCPCYVDGESRTPFFSRDTVDGKFVCNTPMFLDARKYADTLLDVFAHRLRIGMDNTWPFNGDLETMNLVFLKHGVKEKMLILASHLWTNVHYSIYRTSLLPRVMVLPDTTDVVGQYRKKSIFFSETHEHVRSFHGRDWASEKSERHLKDHNIPKLLTQMEGKYETSSAKKREVVFDSIQAFFLFLQFECFVSIEDLHNIIPVKEISYMKRRKSELDGEIRKYR